MYTFKSAARLHLDPYGTFNSLNSTDMCWLRQLRDDGPRTKMDSVFVFSSDSDPRGRSAQIAMPTVFQVVMRDIGKSFQLAITTSRLNLIDYGNATAQSWPSMDTYSCITRQVIHRCWFANISVIWTCWTGSNRGFPFYLKQNQQLFGIDHRVLIVTLWVSTPGQVDS